MPAALPCRPPFVLCSYVVNPNKDIRPGIAVVVLRLALMLALLYNVLRVDSSA